MINSTKVSARNTGKALAIFATLLLIAGCETSNIAPPDQKPAGIYDLPHIKRSNLVVADIDRTLLIYRDILGLEAGKPNVSSPDSYSYPVFNIPKGTPIRTMTLSEPGEQRVLALTELKNIKLPKPANAPFMNAIVIGISDLPAAFEKIEALGLTVTAPEIADGVDFRFIEQAFVDFDGHLVVCYEVIPN